MRKDLSTLNNEKLTIDSREIAGMLEIEHSKVLRKLDGERGRKGYIGILNQAQMGVVNYFIESSYLDAKGEKRKCYLCTKLGCDFLANKFTGEKGVLFTAKYVKKFNQMESVIKNNQLALENKIDRLENMVSNFQESIEEAKQQFKPSHKKKLDYNKMIKVVTNNEEEAQIVKDWVFGVLNINKWEDTCVEESKKIIETITTVSKLLAINKFEQLSLL